METVGCFMTVDTYMRLETIRDVNRTGEWRSREESGMRGIYRETVVSVENRVPRQWGQIDGVTRTNIGRGRTWDIE